MVILRYNVYVVILRKTRRDEATGQFDERRNESARKGPRIRTQTTRSSGSRDLVQEALSARLELHRQSLSWSERNRAHAWPLGLRKRNCSLLGAVHAQRMDPPRWLYSSWHFHNAETQRHDPGVLLCTGCPDHHLASRPSPSAAAQTRRRQCLSTLLQRRLVHAARPCP